MTEYHLQGLTDEEAAARLAAGRGNRMTIRGGKSVFQIVCSHVFTLFNALNILLAVLLLSVRSYRNMLFLGVVVSNTLIGAIQEIRAHRAVEKLQLVHAPKCSVIRSGKEISVSSEELVQGDLVVLRRGDSVPADGTIVWGSGAADESGVTGESREVQKRVGEQLISTSILTQGEVHMVLERVGDESYVAAITREAKSIREPKSELNRSLKKLIRVLSMILLPLGAMLYVKQVFFLNNPIVEAVPSTVAAMLGMIPEGLMLLTSAALAAGVVTLSRKGALVQQMQSIESLARADVICLDKTGTLTTGALRVEEIVPLSGDEAETKRLLSRYLGAFDESSPTLDALRKYTEAGKEKAASLLDFSSERKCSGAWFADGEGVLLGAPSFVMPEEEYTAIHEKEAEKAAQGYRVLILASTRDGFGENVKQLHPKACALIALRDELRPNIGETIAYLTREGVAVKIISGDSPETASAIAGMCGVPGAEKYVNTAGLTEEELRNAAEEYNVFGRVSPDGKRILMDALRKKGHTAAMVGDGVNDIPAMRASDCAIAMPGGSGAARQTAQLTLTGGDFAAVPEIILEGRRVVGNITRSASLFLVKTGYSFLLSVLLLFLPGAYPFKPIQLTLISTLTIGLPSFLLAFEPNHERIRGHFLQTVMVNALPGAAGVTACALCSMMLTHWNVTYDWCTTLATLSAGCVGLIALLRVCLPFTKIRAGVFTLSCVLMLGGVWLLGPVFYLQPLTMSMALVLLALSVLGIAVFGITLWLLRRVRNH